MQPGFVARGDCIGKRLSDDQFTGTGRVGPGGLPGLASLGDGGCWADTLLQAMASTKPHVHLVPSPLCPPLAETVRTTLSRGSGGEVTTTSEPSREMHCAIMQTFVTSHMMRGRVLWTG